MKHAQDVIIAPIITEQSAAQSMDGKYTFKVAAGAKKPEIAQAVEKLFQVKVTSVNTMNYLGKTKRMGMHSGMTPKYRKAVVTIDMDPQPKTWVGADGETHTSDKKYKTAIEEFGFGI